ncbi:hypothetical protein OIU76_028792 [Salix suchowensis]|nr:hypothetical protein OIU78_025544 [Salix suchowensis]KAJ6370578.1 hypothetical protein OIU76_028792 [Salix suchowensis]
MRRSEIVIRRLLDVLMKNLKVTETDKTKESLLMGSKLLSDLSKPLSSLAATQMSRHSQSSSKMMLAVFMSEEMTITGFMFLQLTVPL